MIMKKMYILLLSIFIVLNLNAQDITRTQEFKILRSLWNSVESNSGINELDSVYHQFYVNLDILQQDAYIDSIMNNMLLAIYSARLEYSMYGGLANAVRCAPDISLLASDSAISILENCMKKLDEERKYGNKKESQEDTLLMYNLETSIKVILCRQYCGFAYVGQGESDLSTIEQFLKHCRKVNANPKKQNEELLRKYRNIDLYIPEIKKMILSFI